MNILFSIVILPVPLFENLPKIGWMYFVIMSGFTIAFNVFHLKR